MRDTMADETDTSLQELGDALKAAIPRAVTAVKLAYGELNITVKAEAIVDVLTHGGDHYLLTADYPAYIATQERVDQLYLNQDEWTRRAILNVARMGKFSSDRTVQEYADEIWNVKSWKV